MDKLEKILISMPKNKLSFWADKKIRFRLYSLIIFSFSKKVLTGFKKLLVLNWKLSVLNKTFVVASILVAVFITTSFFAYANGDIVPGNFIYPLKKAVEKIEQKIAPNKTAKIAVYEKQSAHRLQEALNLSQTAANLNAGAEKTNPSEQQNNNTNKLNNNDKKTEIDIKNVNENINKNISEVINNHQTVVESINTLDNYQKATEQANKAKSLDKTTVEYLDKIAEYAATVQDEKTLKKVKEAKEIIDNQKYKYQDQELEDNNKDNKPANENIDKPENRNGDKPVSNNDNKNNGSEQAPKDYQKQESNSPKK